MVHRSVALPALHRSAPRFFFLLRFTPYPTDVFPHTLRRLPSSHHLDIINRRGGPVHWAFPALLANVWLNVLYEYLLLRELLWAHRLPILIHRPPLQRLPWYLLLGVEPTEGRRLLLWVLQILQILPFYVLFHNVPCVFNIQAFWEHFFIYFPLILSIPFFFFVQFLSTVRLFQYFLHLFLFFFVFLVNELKLLFDSSLFCQMLQLKLLHVFGILCHRWRILNLHNIDLRFKLHQLQRIFRMDLLLQALHCGLEALRPFVRFVEHSHFTRVI